MTEVKTELQQNAIADARRHELETFQRALDIQWLNNRMEDGRMGRCLALIKREAEMEKDFQERTDHAAIVNARAAKEAALGVEIANARREEVCALLRRHYLRQKDPSLRELSKKLQAGYVCRDLRQQMLHNQYRRLQEEAEAKEANDCILNSLYNDFEAKEKEGREKLERTTQYCRELQQQLVNRQLQRQCQYEDTLIEKKMLEDVVRTLADEDIREVKQKRDLMEKTRNEMVTFQKARAAWKEKQKQLLILEEHKIEEEAKTPDARSAAVAAARELKQKQKEEINQKIAAKILQDEATRLERVNLIKLLQEQEYLEKNVQDDLAEREKTERVKRETMEALTAQMEAKKALAREMKVKEAEFRKKSEAKMAADEAKEREKEMKKRQKGRAYSQQLLQQIADNERKRNSDNALEERRVADVWDCDRRWREEVAVERQKMIEEHVPSLLGYLQAGVVKKEDLPAVRQGANKREDLAKLNIEGMGAVSKFKIRPKCNDQCKILREY